MKEIARITRHFRDGTQETTSAPEQPYMSADPDCKNMGLKVRGVIIFPDGSTMDVSYGGCQAPPPLDGQHPVERPMLIHRYYEEKNRRFIEEFDKLKKRLVERGSSFNIQLGNTNESIDAIVRLRWLKKEISISIAEVSAAAYTLQQASPQTRQPSQEEFVESEILRQTGESKFYDEVQEIKREGGDE